MASNKTIYKKIAISDAKDRVLKPLSPTMKTKLDTIVSNFIQYLKNAHS